MSARLAVGMLVRHPARGIGTIATLIYRYPARDPFEAWVDFPRIGKRHVKARDLTVIGAGGGRAAGAQGGAVMSCHQTYIEADDTEPPADRAHGAIGELLQGWAAGDYQPVYALVMIGLHFERLDRERRGLSAFDEARR